MSTLRETLMSEGVRNAKLALETKEGKDVVGIVVTANDPLPAGMKYGFEWTVNGRPAGTGQSVTGFKRGDKVALAIAPFDGERKGRIRVLETEIKNTTPRISEVKSILMEENKLSYQVVAQDADGDPITFSLINAPKGIKIDGKGRIDWQPGPGEKEEATITVKVADGHGGEAVYPYRIATEKSQK